MERPFSYIRQDFFLARTFRNLDDLNAQLRDWLDTVANVRLHGTTQRIVVEAFAAEQQELQMLPAFPFDALLKLERRVSHGGLVSIGGNYYSVPDRTRRVVEVHQLPDQLVFSTRGGWLPSTRCWRDGGSTGSTRRIVMARRHGLHIKRLPMRPLWSAASVIVSRNARWPTIRRSAIASLLRESGHEHARLIDDR